MNDTDLQPDTCPVCGHKDTPTWAKTVRAAVIAAALVIVGLAAAWLIRLLWGAL